MSTKSSVFLFHRKWIEIHLYRCGLDHFNNVRMDILVLGKKVNHISFLGIEKIPKYTLKYIKKLSASLCAKLIAYSGNTEHSIPTDDYYTKWREEKEKRVRLEAELAEEKRKH